ncbi:formyltransferase family protein [Sodalinema gerasimenkoae]|uniref:formyltransferase family protein n=1 Tax=Sodalinema gerasimenkoae TaxID=2862348 RepID=UPI001CA4E5FF|nr:formyltransferase family protein [Sodalinema gerasimenkoae]
MRYSEMPSMSSKFLIMADSQVGYAVVKWLLENYKHDIGLVVTIEQNDIWEYAKKRGVNVTVYQSDLNLIKEIENFGLCLELGFLVWWPKIIKDGLIRLPKAGFINTHPSLLPYCRGRHYNFWSIVEQVPFGVTLHFVNAGIDTGDVVAQEPIFYGWEDNGESLYNKAVNKMISLFQKAYPHIRVFKFNKNPQKLSEGSFHFSHEMDNVSRIDLNQKYTAKDLLNLLRARTFKGHPSCWFEDDGEIYEVRVTIVRKSP